MDKQPPVSPEQRHALRGESELTSRVIVFDVVQLDAVAVQLSHFPQEGLDGVLWGFPPAVVIETIQ